MTTTTTTRHRLRDAAVASVVAVLPHEISPLISAASTFFFVRIVSYASLSLLLLASSHFISLIHLWLYGCADPQRLLCRAAAAGRGGHLPGPLHPPGPLRRLPPPHPCRRPCRLPRLLPPIHPQTQGPYSSSLTLSIFISLLFMPQANRLDFLDANFGNALYLYGRNFYTLIVVNHATPALHSHNHENSF